MDSDSENEVENNNPSTETNVPMTDAERENPSRKFISVYSIMMRDSPKDFKEALKIRSDDRKKNPTEEKKGFEDYPAIKALEGYKKAVEKFPQEYGEYKTKKDAWKLKFPLEAKLEHDKSQAKRRKTISDRKANGGPLTGRGKKRKVADSSYTLEARIQAVVLKEFEQWRNELTAPVATPAPVAATV